MCISDSLPSIRHLSIRSPALWLPSAGLLFAGLLLAALPLAWLPSAAAAPTTDLVDPATLRFDDPDGGPLPDFEWQVDPRDGGFDPAPFLSRDTARGSGAVLLQTGEDPEGDSPGQMAFTPDGARVLVAHWGSGNVLVWNEDGTFDEAIDVSGSPWGLGVTPDGLYAVTANLFEDTASILDLSAGTESNTIAVGDQPAVVAINPSGTLAAVGNTVDGSISILELPSGTELRRIPGIGFVASLSANFESGAIGFRFYPFRFVDDVTILHADFFADQVVFVDAQTGGTNAVPVPDAPQTFGLSGDLGTAVVAHTGSNALITVIDTALQSVVKSIPIGTNVNAAVCVDPDGGKAVVAVQNAVRVVDLVTDAVSPDIDTASVNELHTTADGLYAFCVGFRGSLVSFATGSLVKNLNNVVSCTFGAVSPVAARAAMVANTFGEDLLFLDTNGVAGSLDVATLSGPDPEGDKARLTAISPDGSVAAVSQILSDNVGFFDLDAGTFLGVAPAGNRPADLEFTPDGSQVVVANLDSPFATIIDVATRTSTSVNISTRGSQVEISPDGQYAYVSVVVSDGVWRINLQTLSTAGPRLTTGNLGGISYLYSRSSGMSLSHDGSVLVTCNSYSNSISFIDTASWSLLGNMPVGALPVRALFNAADSELYVSNRDSGTVQVLDVASRAVVSTINVGEWPFEAVLSPDEQILYVLNYLDENIGVVDLELGTQVRTIALPDNPGGIELSVLGDEIYVPTGTWSVSIGPGPLVGISFSGTLNVLDLESETVTEQIDAGVPPATISYSPSRARLVVPSTFIDGLYMIERLDPAAAPPGDSAILSRMYAAPNPLSSGTVLTFALERSAPVAISIHDSAGRRIRTLQNGPLAAGLQTRFWDRRDDSAEPVPAGVYFARMSTDDGVSGRRLVVR